MRRKVKLLFIVEAMGGGVFTYIVDLANELVNQYDMYIAYAIRPQTPKDYKNYFDERICLIEVKDFIRSVQSTKDIKAFFEIRKIADQIKPDIIHLHSSKAGAVSYTHLDVYKRQAPYLCRSETKTCFNSPGNGYPEIRRIPAERSCKGGCDLSGNSVNRLQRDTDWGIVRPEMGGYSF